MQRFNTLKYLFHQPLNALAKCVLLLLGLTISLCLAVNAQPYAVSVQHYGVEHGLANRETNAILQDKQGFIWIATKGGLSRFDGKTFSTYNRERNGFAFDDIQLIAQDADGMLWLMAMQKSWEVMIFNPQTGKAQTFFEKFGETLSATPYTSVGSESMASSPDGTVFLVGGSRPAVLLSYHPKTGLRRTPFAQYKTLSFCHPTRQNTIWAIADNNSMVELTPDGRVRHQYRHSIPYLMPLLGSLNNEGPFFYAEYPGVHLPTAVYGIDEGGNRREWPKTLLGDTTKYGVPSPFYLKSLGLVWEDTRLIHPQQGVLLDLAQQGYKQLGGRGTFQDRSGRLWLSINYGINTIKLAPSRFRRLFYDPAGDSEERSAIRGIRVIGNDLYVNQEAKGLYRADRTGRITQTLFETNDWGAMYGLAQDRQGRLVAGGYGKFLRSDTTRRRIQFYPLPGNERFALWSLYAFSETQILAGSDRGLRLVDALTGNVELFRQYNGFSELAESHTLHIGPDRQGTIWLCTITGLYTFDPKRGITARYWSGGKGKYHLPADNFQHFYHAPNGLFWLATANRGLIRWDRARGQARTFRRSDGLSNDNIYAVYPDRRGHLWLSSDYGIMQFDPVRQTTRTYLLEDGISTLEFNRIAHFQEPNGRIYFGGLNGLTTFDPRDFENERPPEPLPLYLTAFRQRDPKTGKVVDKTAEVKQSGRIRIPPDDGTSVLDFAFLNFDDAVRNVYAYQLVGLGEGWQNLPEPTLRLNNLPYGDYSLQIKAQAANGQWSANTLRLNLTVVRPVYLRPWFLALMAALVGAGVWGWVRWRSWSDRQEQQRLKTQIQMATARIEEDNEIISRQAEGLKQLDQTKSRFFANISHEFRTPLTVILGMADELKTADSPPTKLRQIGSLIERNGTNLLRLINQILDLSKIEAGEMSLTLVRTDLVGFIRYVGESFHSIAIGKQIQLAVSSEQTSYETDLDKDKLQDIVSNLLANAIKFTPIGGQVSCQLQFYPHWQPLTPLGFYEEIIPTNHLEGPWIQINVSDSGPGIDPASLAKLFDRFYQTEDQAVSQAGGTGIGLAFVRELVVLMQGGLAVRNRPGQGAEFVVSLPLKTPQEPHSLAYPQTAIPTVNTLPQPLPRREGLKNAQPEDPSYGGGIEATEVDARPVLLLVEDNDDVAAYIQLCVQADYQVIRAENGQRGIDTALERIPDLILSDVMMPLKDGYQVCDTLKNDQRTSHIPIVLLTARAAVGDRVDGLRRGADAYLVKPFQREELMVVLSNQLQTRRVLQLYYSQVALTNAPEMPPATNKADSLEDAFLRKLRGLIEEQLDNADLSIEQICEQMGMSRTALHMKLTALTGMSVVRYVRALRLAKAKDLLTSSALQIGEVAYAVGFDDPKYFSRVFSEEFGVSPGNFRVSSRA